MLILVSADIHLGSPIRSIALRNPELGERLKQGCRDTFADLVSLALEESVDAVALAGDIFDNDSPDIGSRTFLIKQLTKLVDAGIQTFMIRGNHDALLSTASGKYKTLRMGRLADTRKRYRETQAGAGKKQA